MDQINYIKMIHNKKYLHQLGKAVESFDFSQLYDSNVFITGASGLIGSSIVDLLYFINSNYAANIRMFLCGRNQNSLENRFPYMIEDKNSEFISYDVLNPLSINDHIDLIIHAASPASPNVYIDSPVQTILANVLGTKNLLEYILKQGSGKLLYVSSSEVYGNQIEEIISENTPIGSIDINNIRSSYPASKIMAELLVHAYIKQYSLDAIVVRPGYIYGPTAKMTDKRVSSQFAFLAAGGDDIVLKSSGDQRRSYCYCVDCATAIIVSILFGKTGDTFNISNNGSYMSIREMAELYATAGNSKIVFENPDDNEKQAFNVIKKSQLDSTRLANLGWKCLFDNEQAFLDTVSIIKDSL